MIDTLAAQLPIAASLDIKTLFGLEPGGYALVTLHRPANVDDAERFSSLIDLIRYVSERIHVFFPVHPRTRTQLWSSGLAVRLDGRVTLSGPIGYLENLALMKGAKAVLTDSGGMQDETTFLSVPCITLRTSTERPITVSHGTNTIVGNDLSSAYTAFDQVLAGSYRQGQPIRGWDGRASERIARVVSSVWFDE
jgi:UDP-N-acetylglucosamine 2-epimerase (non-hydrolysing)